MSLLPQTLGSIAVGLSFISVIGQPIPASAQIRTVRPPITTGRKVSTAPHQEPCWQEAGISKSTMEQRRSIQQSARAEIQSVCANSSLTPQQRREQIRAIHERTRQQMEESITPQQREALKSCQEARRATHPAGGGFHGGGGGGQGPCGELNEPKEREPERQP